MVAGLVGVGPFGRPSVAVPVLLGNCDEEASVDVLQPPVPAAVSNSAAPSTPALRRCSGPVIDNPLGH